MSMQNFSKTQVFEKQTMELNIWFLSFIAKCGIMLSIMMSNHPIVTDDKISRIPREFFLTIGQDGTGFQSF